MVIVSVEALTHRYGAKEALRGLSFRVRQGEIYGLLGPNGSGKSTLLRILATLAKPGGGRAAIAGQDVVTQPREVRRMLGVVFQSQSLDRKLSVTENLACQGWLYGLVGSRLRKRIETVLERLRLEDRRDAIVNTLSGGLRRRVEIAKALLHEPRLLLMDEASTGLDPAARLELFDYIRELRDSQGVTVLLTTHILDEADRCDRLVLIHEGRGVTEGSPAELKAGVRGDVVVLETDQPAEAADRIRERFKVEPVFADGTVRVEIGDGHRFVAEVVEALPGAIRSVVLHRPTLEDVFLHETGVPLC